jgi:hypothetical protein
MRSILFPAPAMPICNAHGYRAIAFLKATKAKAFEFAAI